MNYPLYTSLTLFAGLIAVSGVVLFMLSREPNFSAAINVNTQGTSTLKGLNLSEGCLTYAGGSCVGGAPTTYATSSEIRVVTSGGAATSTFVTIPAGTSVVTIDGAGSGNTSTNANNCSITLAAGSTGVPIATQTVYNDNQQSQSYTFHAVLLNSASSQNTFLGSGSWGGEAATPTGMGQIVSSTIDLSTTQDLSIVLKAAGAGTPNCTLSGYTVTIQQ